MHGLGYKVRDLALEHGYIANSGRAYLATLMELPAFPVALFPLNKVFVRGETGLIRVRPV